MKNARARPDARRGGIHETLPPDIMGKTLYVLFVRKEVTKSFTCASYVHYVRHSSTPDAMPFSPNTAVDHWIHYESLLSVIFEAGTAKRDIVQKWLSDANTCWGEKLTPKLGDPINATTHRSINDVH